MSMGINRVTLLGNLGADPDLRHTQGGQSVLNMRLACSESWLDKASNERKEKTEWVSVVLWGRRAEALSSILHKGSQILVEGKLQTSSYEDREGVKRYRTDVVALNIVLTGKKEGGGQSKPARDDFDNGLGDDEIPF